MTRICVIDFETTYSREYSLSKITTESYIRDPQFQTIGFAAKFDNWPTDWVAGPDASASALSKLDWSDTLVVAQNTAFDGAIMAWHYGINPMAWVDIMGMSRALYPHDRSHSLKAQAERMGAGVKGDEVNNAKGMHYKDFTPYELAKYGEKSL